MEITTKLQPVLVSLGLHGIGCCPCLPSCVKQNENVNTSLHVLVIKRLSAKWFLKGVLTSRTPVTLYKETHTLAAPCQSPHSLNTFIREMYQEQPEVKSE